jgi:hypothetical protein
MNTVGGRVRHFSRFLRSGPRCCRHRLGYGCPQATSQKREVAHPADSLSGTTDSQTCNYYFDDLARLGGKDANGYSVDCGRVAQPSDGKPHSGCPILRGFLRRVGGRLIAPWASPFTPRVPETKSSPNPHSPALAPTPRENRIDNCSSANPQVSPSDLASPDCGAYSAVSPLASSLSKH